MVVVNWTDEPQGIFLSSELGLVFFSLLQSFQLNFDYFSLDLIDIVGIGSS